MTLDHLERIQRETAIHHGSTVVEITIQMVPLSKLLNENEIKTIHFFSLDVEGGELSVLKGIDLKAIDVKLFMIEENRGDVHDYITKQGYKQQYWGISQDRLYLKE